ncbi:putative replication protein, partial [Escherichia coli FRIK1985]
MVKPDAAIQ